VNSPTLLDVRLDTLNKTAVLKRLGSWFESKAFHHVATVNPEFLVEAHSNHSFKHILNHTDLNVCDGVGLSLWGRLLYGYRLPRITGVELAEAICELAAQKKKSVYFLGGFGVAQAAADKMKNVYPKLIIAGAEDGDPNLLSTKIVQSKPAVILVAFGAPKQEAWIAQFKSELPHTRLAIGIGGTFDFWTGKAKRAPKEFRAIGFEWLWRLITEPKRAHRIYNAVVVFSYLAIKEKITRKA